MGSVTARGAVSAWLTAMSVALAAVAWTAGWFLWRDGPRTGAVGCAVVAIPLTLLAVARMRQSMRRTDEPTIYPPG